MLREEVEATEYYEHYPFKAYEGGRSPMGRIGDWLTQSLRHL